MTTDEIRALDGPALTRLAWELGLAPAGASVAGGLVWFSSEAWETHTWTPHANLAQADAVFRQLRALGWDTFQGYDAQHQWAWVTAWKVRLLATIEEKWQEPNAGAESLALLRCAVQAVASEAEENKPHD